MKKLLAIVAIAAITITSTFATSAETTTTATTTGAVTLNSTKAQDPYSLSLYYGEENFTSSALKTVDNIDLTAAGTSKNITVKLSDGNLNNDVTYTTTVTELPFTGIVNGETYTTKNILKVNAVSDGSNKTSYTSVVKAGPNASQSVAEFYFSWTADTALPAGSFSTTNTISISVN